MLLFFIFNTGILTELIDLVFSDRKVKTIGTDVLSSLTSILDRAVLGNVLNLALSIGKERPEETMYDVHCPYHVFGAWYISLCQATLQK